MNSLSLNYDHLTRVKNAWKLDNKPGIKIYNYDVPNIFMSFMDFIHR